MVRQKDEKTLSFKNVFRLVNLNILCYYLYVRLIPIAEGHWKLEPFLTRKGSPRPDRLNILSDQAFHIHTGIRSQIIPAYLYRF